MPKCITAWYLAYSPIWGSIDHQISWNRLCHQTNLLADGLEGLSLWPPLPSGACLSFGAVTLNETMDWATVFDPDSISPVQVRDFVQIYKASLVELCRVV